MNLFSKTEEHLPQAEYENAIAFLSFLVKCWLALRAQTDAFLLRKSCEAIHRIF